MGQVVPNLKNQTSLSTLKFASDESEKIRCVILLLLEVCIKYRLKMLIFCALPAIMIQMLDILQALRIPVTIISADITTDQRNEIVQRFNETKAPQVLVLSYRISSTGLNLQKRCHFIALVDPPPLLKI